MFIYKFLILLVLSYSEANILMIGDSLLAPNTNIPVYLSEKMNKTVDMIDDRATIGAGIEEGWVRSILSQYNNDNYTTIIMDGGGNDILSIEYECRQFSLRCKEKIDSISQKLGDLFEKMSYNGIKNIIFVGYYYIKNLNRAIDYGSEQIIEICQKSSAQCFFCDLRNLSFPLSFDNIHPRDEEGYKKITNLIWNTIVTNNIII